MFTGLLSGWFQYNVGEGAFMALLGFVFVVCGITLLVLLFSGLGKIMSVSGKKKASGAKSNPKHADSDSQSKNDGISPETLAVISVAIAAYYEGENVKCDFVVRRIKKL